MSLARLIQEIKFGESYKRIWRQLFPRRDVLILANDGISYHRLSSSRQFLVLAGGALCVVWGVGASVGYFIAKEESKTEHAGALQAKLAYGRLVNRVEITQQRFAAIADQMHSSHQELAELSTQNKQLRNEIETVVSKLEVTETERARFHNLSSTMTRQLDSLKTHVTDFSRNNSSLRERLDTVQTEVADIAGERDRALMRVDELKLALAKSQGTIAQLEAAKGYAVDRASSYAEATIGEYEAVLAMTGIDVERLLQETPDTPIAEDAMSVGMGGPFIADGGEDLQPVTAALTEELDAFDARIDRLTQLQTALQTLPLATPLDNFYVASLFGKRRDPINGRWAQHNGVDLAGPKKTPIYAAASGIVIKAGRNGKYGRMIQVDHGNGITSLYGHLYRTLVKKGDKVAYRDRIGLMGNSGRSTGTHLHYEIRVDDKAVDPMKFIKAGRYVFQKK